MTPNVKKIALTGIAAILSIALVSEAVAGSKARATKRMLGVAITAVISGAVSGAVAAEVAHQYAVKRSAIHGDWFETTEPVRGISRDGDQITVPVGSYYIVTEDVNDYGDTFIVIENTTIEDITIVFIEA